MHFFIEFVFQYKVPNVNKTRGLVAKVADDLWAQIRGMLGTDCRRCSATTDIWSSKLYNDSYLGMADFEVVVSEGSFLEDSVGAE